MCCNDSGFAVSTGMTSCVSIPNLFENRSKFTMRVYTCVTVYWLVESLGVMIIHMGELPINGGHFIRLRLELNLHLYLLATTLTETSAPSLCPPPAQQMTL